MQLPNNSSVLHLSYAVRKALQTAFTFRFVAGLQASKTFHGFTVSCIDVRSGHFAAVLCYAVLCWAGLRWAGLGCAACFQSDLSVNHMTSTPNHSNALVCILA